MLSLLFLRNPARYFSSRFAPTDTLRSFTTMMIKIGPPSDNDTGGEISAKFVVLMALRSAEFWELQNIRGKGLSAPSSPTSNLYIAAILLHEINAMTKFLDAIDAREFFVQDKVLQVDTKSVTHAFEVYKMLLHVPIDYMTRTARTDLVRRAMTFDAVILKAEGSAREIGSLRTFMKRVWEWIGAVDHPVSAQF